MRLDPREQLGLSLPGMLSLVAIVSVLVIVSLPRLRGFAVHENELDARQTVTLLAEELESWRATGPSDGVPFIARLVDSVELSQALADADFTEEGRYLRRHGYLFTVVELPPPPRFETSFDRPVFAAHDDAPTQPRWEPRLGVRAWPLKHGNTGQVALLATEDGRLFHHANRSGAWSGMSELRDSTSWRGWRELSR